MTGLCLKRITLTMRNLTVTQYRSTTSSGKSSRAVTLTWPGTGVAALTEPCKSTPDREAVPLIMAGSTDGERGDIHVTARSMLCMDIDCKPKDDEAERAWATRSGIVRKEMLAALQFLAGDEGFDHAWHTTHSHDDDKRLGWRVWIPLAEDVPADRLVLWRDAIHAVNIKVFNRIADTTTYNPERLMRLPATHPERLDVYDFGARADGKLFSFETALQWWKDLPSEERNKQRGKRATSAPKIYAKIQLGEEYPLPSEIVITLRQQCAQIALGNERLKAETRNALCAIAQCEALKKGERDNGLAGLSGIFAHRFLAYEARPLLLSLLLPVLRKTHAEDPSDPIKPNHADPEDLCDWVIQQVEGRRAENQSPDGHTQVSDVEAGTIREWTNGARSGGMSRDELAVIAQGQGTDVERFKRQLFVSYEKSTFIWQVNRYFERPISQTELTLATAQAVLAGVGLSRKKFIEAKNEFKMLSMLDIMAQHATKAIGVRASYLTKASHFSWDDKRYVEAMGARANLTPERHDAAHEWLLTLGGEKLVDWVSSLPDVSRPTGILLLALPALAGKNLFAHGLSKLWQRGTPVDALEAFGPYNGGLSETPFIWADENLPKFHGKSMGDELRRIITNPDVPIRRMYHPTVKCAGYVRMLITANSDSPMVGFASGAQLKKNDLSAIAERLILIEGQNAAVDYLEKFPQKEVDSWRSESKLARHALWLAENWKRKTEGRRLVVEGNSERSLLKLVVGDELTSQVLGWFVSYALHTTKKTTGSIRQGFFSSGGELYVSLSVITESWGDYKPAYRMGSDEPFLAALEAVAHPGRYRVRRGEGEKKDTRTYWKLNLSYLEFYAERHGRGAEQLRRAIMERDDPSAEFLAHGDPANIQQEAAREFDSRPNVVVPIKRVSAEEL